MNDTTSELVISDVIRQRLILLIISEYTNVPTQYIISRNRKSENVYARQLATYFLYKHTRYSQVKIGEILGGRDHSTVIYSLKAMSDRLDTEERTVQDVQNIQKIILSRL